MEDIAIHEEGKLIAGLDLGTTKVCAVIGEVFSDRVVIVGIGTALSSGVKKGVVVNIEATVKAIQQAMAEACEMADCEIGSVFVGIAGDHIKGFNSPGIIAINNQEVTQSHIAEVEEAAQTVKLSDNQEIIHVLPQEYMVDDHTGIQNPLGMTGVRLATNVHIVTADTTAVRNLVVSCERAGFDVSQVVLESVASAEAVLSAEEKEQGVALVDIGGGTTDLALFCKGSIKHTWELSMGGNHLTSDLSHGLRTPMQEAEGLKCLYGGAISGMVKDNLVIEVPTVGERKARKISQRVMVEVLEARMEVILEMINKNISASGYRNQLNSGVVLTGGTSLLTNIVELAEQVFDMPVRLGVPAGIEGTIEELQSPRCSTAIGLVLYGNQIERRRVAESKGFFSKIFGWFS